MPQTYIRTTGPTSKGTIDCCAVSKSSMVMRSAGAAAGADALDPERALALVPEVDGEQRGGERLEAHRVLERTRIESAEIGDGVDEVEHGRASLFVADDQDVAGERLADVGERGGGYEVE